MKIRTVQEEVEEILVKNPEARDSDEKLYGIYLTGKIGLESAIVFFLNYSARYKDRVASFETVSRCRRKIQEKNPRLRASAAVQDFRNDMQSSFFDYVRGFDTDV